MKSHFQPDFTNNVFNRATLDRIRMCSCMTNFCLNFYEYLCKKIFNKQIRIYFPQIWIKNTKIIQIGMIFAQILTQKLGNILGKISTRVYSKLLKLKRQKICILAWAYWPFSTDYVLSNMPSFWPSYSLKLC